MSSRQESVDEQLDRIREALKALEFNAEQTILSGDSDLNSRGARLAILADGGGHIWQAAEPEASNEELAEVVDALIAHLENFRERLRHDSSIQETTAH